MCLDSPHTFACIKLTNSKSCIQGICSPSSYAPVSSCPFGDDVVVNGAAIYTQLPKTQMSCAEVFSFITNSLKQSPLDYCASTDFRSTCCSYCKRKDYSLCCFCFCCCCWLVPICFLKKGYEKLTCFDQSLSCAINFQYCNTGASLNGININTVCPKTCGKCSGKYRKIYRSETHFFYL